MDTGLKALLIEGGAAKTVRVAEAAFPLPLSVELTAVVKLFLVPAKFATMLTLRAKVSPMPKGMVPPTKLTVVDPAVKPTGMPPQLFVAFGVAATARPAGKVSLKPMPVRPSIFGLLMENVRVEVPLS